MKTAKVAVELSAKHALLSMMTMASFVYDALAIPNLHHLPILHHLALHNAFHIASFCIASLPSVMYILHRILTYDEDARC